MESGRHIGHGIGLAKHWVTFALRPNRCPTPTHSLLRASRSYEDLEYYIISCLMGKA